VVRRADLHHAAPPRSVDLTVPEVALVVVAHPDDAEFQCGGTLAKWARLGTRLHHLVLTDGSKGTWDAGADQAALVATRFLDQVDGELTSDLWLRGEVARVIRSLRPEVVLGHDPWKRYRLHPDHRHAGQLVCDAIVAARDPHFFRDHGIAPHRPRTLLLWEADEPNHVEDVSDWVAVKLAALEAHVSQFESTMKAVDDEQLRAFRDRLVGRLGALGQRFGVGAAEIFRRIDDL